MAKQEVKNANPVVLNDQGEASRESIGNGLVKVIDRDGRVNILPEDGSDAANLSDEQRQAAADAMIDASPVRNELSPAHSDFDPSAHLVNPDPKEADNVNVVNVGLGVDRDANEANNSESK